MASQRMSLATEVERNEGYDQFEAAIRKRVSEFTGRLFTTDVDPEVLWAAYLDGFPTDRRQHYNCHCCRRFIQRYGGLVQIGDQLGGLVSLLWNGVNPAPFFDKSVAALRGLISKAKVTGVFLWTETTWGTPQTGDWTHLSGCPAKMYHYHSPVQTAEQVMAEKKQDFIILCNSLMDYNRDVVSQALRVLRADAIQRSEKALGVAEWFDGLHSRIESVKGPRRANLIWAAVADAPPGFCHVRSTIISTLLDDIKQGMPFDRIAARWAEKVHPLQYQRPTAAPSSGAIEAAEKLVEKLGVARSFGRRFARLDEVLATLWTPPTPATPAPSKPGGLFDHLKNGGAGAGPKAVTLPTTQITWVRFIRDVLPTAKSMDVLVPTRAGFYGLTTAEDPEAPPIIQWDGLPDFKNPNGDWVFHDRNPVSWYFYSGGSPAHQWNLSPCGYAPVTAVFLPPHQWQQPAKFTHHARQVFFSIAGCWDQNGDKHGLALFPEILRAELRGIRSVIEAHSRKGGVRDPQLGTANGLLFYPKGPALNLRVTDAGGTATYSLDRWE